MSNSSHATDKRRQSPPPKPLTQLEPFTHVNDSIYLLNKMFMSDQFLSVVMPITVVGTKTVAGL